MVAFHTSCSGFLLSELCGASPLIPLIEEALLWGGAAGKGRDPLSDLRNSSGWMFLGVVGGGRKLPIDDCCIAIGRESWLAPPKRNGPI